MLHFFYFLHRYSAVRKQFTAPGENQEQIILDYPMQQWRLFPYLAAAYVLNHVNQTFSDYFAQFHIENMKKEDLDRLAEYSREVHALSCAAKPVAGWTAKYCIEESREACGGHGYLVAAGFGNIRNDNDANCTYEGDNNVILAQTAAWILGLWKRVRSSGGDIDLPMGTANFLAQQNPQALPPLTMNSDDQAVGHFCLATLEFLVRELCEKTTAEMESLKSQGYDSFAVKNHTQVYMAHTLAQVYFHALAMRWYQNALKDCPDSLRPVFLRMWALYGASRTLPLLHYHSTIPVASIAQCLQRHTLRLCSALRPDAVSLVDALAPPDFCLNSVLGSSDGRVYERLEEAMLGAPNATERRPYWREMTYPAKKKVMSKL